MKSSLLIGVIALFVGLGCGSDDVGGAHSTSGTVVGHVTLEGAEDFSGVEVHADGVSTTTDAEGSYRLDQVSTGELEVSAAFDGYIGQTKTTEVGSDEPAVVDFELGVENRPPVIDSVDVDPAVLLPGETAQVTVTAHDPDNTDLVYSYEIGEGFEVEAVDEDGNAELSAPDEFGVVAELVVVVEDEAGDSDQMSVDVETRTNDAPVIESISAIPEVLNPGGIGELSVDATDPDGDELFYRWEAPDGWDLSTDDVPQVEITAPNQPDETAIVEVFVDDGLGGEATAQVQVMTRENSAPQILELTAAPAQAVPGGELDLFVDATDPDGGDLDYLWSAPSEWTIVDGAAPSTTLIAPDEYGNTAAVEIEVTDEYGATASGIIVVSTIENQGPQIQSVTADPIMVERLGTSTLEAVATHPQDQVLTYDWDAPADWTLIDDPDAPASPDIEAPDLAGETATVTVTVTDPDGKEAVGSVVVSTFENQAPIIESLDAMPSAVVPGETLTVEATAYDPDGYDLTYDWTIPAGWTGTSTDDSIDLVAPDDYGVTGTVILEVSDGLDTTSASVTVSTVQNIAPNISSFTADPYVVDRQASSQLTVVASDPYGDPLSYSWTIDNADWTLIENGDTATLQAPDIADDSVTVTVVVDDGYGGSTDASVVVVTAQNSAPNITGFTADPYVVERQGISELEVHATDPDGDELSYDWSTNNTNWSLAENEETATITAPDIAGDSVTVTVEVDDGYGGVVSTSVVVQTEANNPPSITSFTADPLIVDREGISQLEVQAFDPDGEPLSYTWSIDNPDWMITDMGTEASAEAPDIPDSTATVTVEVDDGYGGTTSADLVIETVPNEEPVVTDLSVDPADWIVQGGTADLSVDASSPDGDSLTYDWSVPTGWSIVGDGDQVELHAPDTNDESATITVTVTDPWGASDSESISVRTQDTEANPFAFVDVDGAGPNQQVTSNAVAVDGFDGPVSAVCTDCEVSVNGGPFGAIVDDVFPGDSIEIRVTSGDLEETVTAFVTVGDTDSDSWTVTTTDWEGERIFSTCGQSGNTGPTAADCDSAYDGSNLEGEITVDDGIQIWTVPADGTYRIEALGGQGFGTYGGRGARIAGEFDFQAGDEVLILVGHQGAPSIDSDNQYGGGGGSFVATGASYTSADPILVAGGGGGSHINSFNSAPDANTGTAGSDGINGCQAEASGGTGGNGGGTASSSDGGGGFFGDGGGDAGGAAFVNGGEGGIDRGEGGFGSGGGASSWDHHRGAGGGGYSGGGGSRCNDGTPAGGGGGSYNTGVNQDNAAGINEGHGQVTIDLVG